MLLLEQVELTFERSTIATSRDVASKIVGQALRLPNPAETATGAVALQSRAGHDFELERKAREILTLLGAPRLGRLIRVEWNARLKTCAGRADFRNKLITLNPRLHEVRAGLAVDEIDRTFRHELAHLLAQFRAGRKRIAPHGDEWRAACVDLGIGDEKRTHNLPFPIRELPRRFVYRCPNCAREFSRVRKIRRTIACLACCRKNNGGEFDPRFRLKLTTNLT